MSELAESPPRPLGFGAAYRGFAGVAKLALAGAAACLLALFGALMLLFLVALPLLLVLDWLRPSTRGNPRRLLAALWAMRSSARKAPG